jgi:hypothetical protein
MKTPGRGDSVLLLPEKVRNIHKKIVSPDCTLRRLIIFDQWESLTVINKGFIITVDFGRRFICS